MLNTVYIALGSNIGDRQSNLDQAIRLLGSYEDTEIVAVSSYLNNPAVADTYQPDYLNAAIEVRTLLSLRELFAITLDIERQLGRQSKGTSDPRTIDLDILLFNDLILSDDDLVVPHPLMQDRVFVLKPLCELIPAGIHPILNESMQALYDKIK
ncbi:2-amino-4-hydroxy-6-hydroxymethyldihydropteridine diphosphokinase [bacterium]|nr:2-amino-4-hydroxy-6-hydroxymethyldihydropteridine diphosphokinase [bacterium]|tara:strand:- start:152 stop:613 length:462 start_codon:yes stop_codon:yes gene_type:complete